MSCGVRNNWVTTKHGDVFAKLHPLFLSPSRLLALGPGCWQVAHRSFKANSNRISTPKTGHFLKIIYLDSEGRQ
jgi:hypothetical protein